jgi:SAM-dependent methyltransferase
MAAKEALGPRSAEQAIYAPPQTVTNLQDCLFYHTMDIPGYGLVQGDWDLRGHVDAYLGGVDLAGKRVLELGTASGFLCFEMERRGARVVAYDLSEHQQWDLVPFAAPNNSTPEDERNQLIRKLNNGYWLAHSANQSSARVVYGRIYEVPAGIGAVDVATFGCILLHVRDPLGALASALRLVRETVVITEPDWHPPLASPRPGRPVGLKAQCGRFIDWLLGWRLRTYVRRIQELESFVQKLPLMTFMPDFRIRDQNDTWWYLRPALLCEFLGVLGFEDTKVSYHTQLYKGKPTPAFTVVGRRSRPGTVALHVPAG